MRTGIPRGTATGGRTLSSAAFCNRRSRRRSARLLAISARVAVTCPTLRGCSVRGCALRVGIAWGRRGLNDMHALSNPLPIRTLYPELMALVYAVVGFWLA